MKTYNSDQLKISNKRGLWPADLAPSLNLTSWLAESELTKDLFRGISANHNMEAVTFAAKASKAIAKLIQKESDSGPIDYWYFPDETLLAGTGDCEDHAFLLARVLMYHEELANKVLVCFGEVTCQEVTGRHAWVQIQQEDNNFLLLDTYLASEENPHDVDYSLAAMLGRYEFTIFNNKEPEEIFQSNYSWGFLKRVTKKVTDTVGGAVSTVASTIGGAAESLVKDKIYGAMLSAAEDEAKDWRAKQGPGSNADYEDCVRVVAAAMAASGAAIGASVGSAVPAAGTAVGAAVGAALGTGSGIPLARVACRRVV